jgi:hypothetical protein
MMRERKVKRNIACYMCNETVKNYFRLELCDACYQWVRKLDKLGAKALRSYVAGFELRRYRMGCRAGRVESLGLSAAS